MANVRGSIQVKRLRQADSLSANLVSTKSLIQYLGEGVQVNPDWTVGANQPTIYPSVRSSLQTGIITAITNMKWWYDGTEITEANTNFQITTTSIGGVSIPALKIVKNIMVGTTTNKSIRASFDVSTGGYTTKMETTIDVQRQVTSATTYVGEIGATNGGVITTDQDELTINAVLMKGGQPVPVFTIEWWKVVANDTDGTPDGLMNTGLTTKTIKRKKEHVDLQETYVAKFFIGGSQVATATIDLLDLTDPYIMKFNMTPTSGIVEPTTPLRITPVVVTKGTSTVITTFSKFAFALMNGTSLIRSQAYTATNNKYFDVNYNDLDSNNVDSLDVNVESSDSW